MNEKVVTREIKPCFELGQTVCTNAIYEAINAEGASRLILRHVSGDFGDICDEDKQANLDAIKNGYRIFSSYDTDDGTIFVITEADRSATTVLFANEY